MRLGASLCDQKQITPSYMKTSEDHAVWYYSTLCIDKLSYRAASDHCSIVEVCNSADGVLVWTVTDNHSWYLELNLEIGGKFYSQYTLILI